MAEDLHFLDDGQVVVVWCHPQHEAVLYVQWDLPRVSELSYEGMQGVGVWHPSYETWCEITDRSQIRTAICCSILKLRTAANIHRVFCGKPRSLLAVCPLVHSIFAAHRLFAAASSVWGGKVEGGGPACRSRWQDFGQMGRQGREQSVRGWNGR